MRSLSPIELAALVNMASFPDYDAADDDPLEPGWNACVERGLATYTVTYDVEWTTRTWQINDLGRLALRIHSSAVLGG